MPKITGHASSTRPQQSVEPHGATRSLPDLAEHSWTLQSKGGNVPVILLFWSSLRRRGALARRAGRRGRGGNSQGLQRRELADLGRNRAVDLVAVEDPATPRAVARRAGRPGRGGNSQVLQRRELADLGRDPTLDLVEAEIPATPRGGRAPRRASGTRGELAGAPAPRACRSRSGSCR